MADVTLLYGALDALKALNLTDAITHIETYLAQLESEAHDA